MRLAALLALPLAAHAITVPLSFDPLYDPPLSVIVGHAARKYGLRVGGLSLDVDVGLTKRGDTSKRCASKKRTPLGLQLDVPGLSVNVSLPSLGGILGPLKPKPDSGFDGRSTLQADNIGADNEWSVAIGIGTPPQQLSVVLDSGSTDAFLYDSTCVNCDLNNHTAFDASRSSTFSTRTSATFTNATFADGSSVTGYTANDTFTLGGKLKVKSQLMGLVTNRSGFRSGATYDGIVGLSRDAQSFLVFTDTGAPSIFGSAVRQGILDKPVIGVALKKAGPGNLGGGGEYSFGSINSALIDGEIAYVDVISKNAWGVPLDDVTANGTSLMATDDPRRALVDTGTTLIYVADAVATALHALIPGAAYVDSTETWTVPCETSRLTTGAPDVFFSLAGSTFGVPASDLAFQGGWKTGTCLSGVQGGSNDFTVLGDVFIKNHYVVFDLVTRETESITPRIGFANRTDVASSTVVARLG